MSDIHPLPIPLRPPPLSGSIDDPSKPSTAGVFGEGGHNPGVAGSSVHDDGVQGLTETSDHHGVVGRNGSSQALGSLGGSDPVFKQHAGVYGQSDQQGVMGLTTASGGTGVYGGGTTAAAGAQIGVRGETLTGVGVQGQSFGGGVGVAGISKDGIGVHGVGGRLAGQFDGDVEITGAINHNGDFKCTGNAEITGNLNMSSRTSDITLGDVAEGFSTQDGEIIEPGTVVVLNQHGLVRPGDEAYDKRVAGVVSGAGDYRPAIVLDKQLSQASRLPVALIGKVRCKVDAQYSPIAVGDLLTTSPTLGHAMKAADPLKAFGSVIGKALGPLKDGRGLIPILIALQ